MNLCKIHIIIWKYNIFIIEKMVMTNQIKKRQLFPDSCLPEGKYSARLPDEAGDLSAICKQTPICGWQGRPVLGLPTHFWIQKLIQT